MARTLGVLVISLCASLTVGCSSPTDDDDVVDDCTPVGDCALPPEGFLIYPEEGDDLTPWGLALRDVQGDGLADAILGDAVNLGGVRVFYGPICEDRSAGDWDVEITGPASKDFGSVLAANGDLDGDGRRDLIVGAPQEFSGTERGEVYVFAGPLAGSLTAEDATALLLGENDRDNAGRVVAYAGDVDGDGHDDMLVGTDEYPGGIGQGVVYLWSGPVVGEHSLGDADAIVTGEAESDQAGISAAGAGDIDGDGFDDLVIGAQRYDGPGTNSGAAYVLYGPVSGSVSLENADARLEGEKENDHAGSAVAGPGDLNGDGYDDLVIGASWESTMGTKAGAIYLLNGPVSGTISLADADHKILGDCCEVGQLLIPAGDLDADGSADLVVGSNGAVHLLHGPELNVSELADVEMLLADDTGYEGVRWFGFQAAGGADTNCDGLDDLLVASGAGESWDDPYWPGGAHLFGGS